MKNKKAWIIGTAMGLSTVMLATVAFAGTSATSGYDALKAAMRTQHAVEVRNATVDFDVSVSEGAQSLVNVNAAMKMDSEARQMSGVVTVKGAGVDRTITTYQTENTGYLNVSGSETWFQTDRTEMNGSDARMNGRMGGTHGMRGDSRFEGQYHMGAGMPMMNGMDPNAEKFAETFLDTLMGDLKQAVVLTENGTEKTFSLKIDQSNMPELMKAALALGASSRMEERDAAPNLTEEKMARIGNPAAEAQMKALLPEMTRLHDAIDLTDNVTVDSIDMSVTVDADNQPVSGKTTVVVSGDAADGTAHTYTVDMAFRFSAVGSTVPDTFDSEGKDIQVVQVPMHHNAEW
jgi:hypothetical protein